MFLIGFVSSFLSFSSTILSSLSSSKYSASSSKLFMLLLTPSEYCFYLLNMLGVWALGKGIILRDSVWSLANTKSSFFWSPNVSDNSNILRTSFPRHLMSFLFILNSKSSKISRLMKQWIVIFKFTLKLVIHSQHIVKSQNKNCTVSVEEKWRLIKREFIKIIRIDLFHMYCFHWY